MTNWYYVEQNERRGPVAESALHELIKNKTLHEESYVWKKGFPAWEKIKNIDELALLIEIDLPVMSDLNKNKNESIYFIKIGPDRSKIDEDFFGPYSVVELKEAYEQKRINAHTQVFTLGETYWKELKDHSFLRQVLEIKTDQNLVLENHHHDCPLIFYVKGEDHTFLFVVKEINMKEVHILGNRILEKGQTLSFCCFKGRECVVKEISTSVIDGNQFEQKTILTLETFPQGLGELIREFNA